MNQDSAATTTESPSRYAQGEIDLFGLAAGLWLKKMAIICITLTIVVAGAVYVAITPSRYVASAQIRPPKLFDLVQINETPSLEEAREAGLSSTKKESELLTVTPHMAFQRATFELKSAEVQNLVLGIMLAERKGERPEEICEEDENFACYEVGIELPRTAQNSSLQPSDAVTVTVSHQHPELARDLLNEHIRQVNNKVSNALVGERQGSLAARISHLEMQISRAISMEHLDNTDTITRLTEEDELARLDLEDRIAALQKKAAQLRLDKISSIEEAFFIAKNLNIEEPISLTQLSQRQASEQGGMAISADFSNRSDPAFLRGTRMLSVEITALKKRESDDFTIPEIRTLQEELALLDTNREIQLLNARKDNSAFVSNIRSLRIKLDRLRSQANQDYRSVRVLGLVQAPETPEHPDRPRKALILIFSLFAGGFLGILVALVMMAADRRQTA